MRDGTPLNRRLCREALAELDPPPTPEAAEALLRFADRMEAQKVWFGGRVSLAGVPHFAFNGESRRYLLTLDQVAGVMSELDAGRPVDWEGLAVAEGAPPSPPKGS